MKNILRDFYFSKNTQFMVLQRLFHTVCTGNLKEIGEDSRDSPPDSLSTHRRISIQK